MEPKRSLDDILKDKLQRVQPVFDPNSWDDLEQRMQQADMDEHISAVLHRMRPAYRESSWTPLKLRLERLAAHRAGLLRAKILELALAFSCLLLLWKFFPDQQRPQPIYATADAVATTPSYSARFPRLIDVVPSQLPPLDLSTRADFSRWQSPLDIGHFAPVSALGSVDDPLAALAYPTFSVPTPEYSYSRSLPAPTPSVSTSPLAPLALPSSDVAPDIQLIKAKRGVRVGFVGSVGDINRIVSPEIITSTKRTYPARTQYALGYSGGIMLGFEGRRSEWETGLVYTARSYPVEVFVVSDVREQVEGLGLKRLEYNTVDIPLQINRTLWQHARWRAYAAGGISLNLILDATFYKGDESDYDLGHRSAVGARSPDEQAEELRKLAAAFDLSPGILQGGNVFENATLYGRLGLGVERSFLSGTSLFLQPTYHHSFYYFRGGVGPLNDRIHNLNLLLGLKLRL